MEKIKIGIAGYGNIGKGVEKAIAANPDTELKLILTRRDPSKITPATKGVTVATVSDAAKYKDCIDVLILCGGSATDLPEQGPQFAEMFNTVDSFDTHARIPEYLKSVDSAAKKSGNLSLISIGWDPGLFSLIRAVSGAALPDGRDYTFWGKGISQGHSDAIRRVPGVKDARQYTIPVDEAVQSVRNGENPSLSTRQKHTRLCYVVAEDGADKDKIRESIVTMPNYFSDYDTTVNFISEEELVRDHSKMPHGGFVFRSGCTGENKHIIEFSLKLDSNPEFTGSVLVAYARAVYRMRKAGKTGGITIFDVAPVDLCAQERDQLIAHSL